MSAHLGSLISALVDDQLPPIERERALSHAAGCAQCAQEISATRAARGILASGSQPTVRTDFLSGLMSMAAMERDSQAAADEVRPSDNPFIVREAIPTCKFSGEILRRNRARKAAKVMVPVLLSGGLAFAFTLGARPLVTPEVGQDFLSSRLSLMNSNPWFVPVHEVSSDADPGAVDDTKFVSWMRGHGWRVPENMADTVTVKQVGYSSDSPHELEITLDTSAGPVLLTERKGDLDDEAISEATVIEHEGGPIYVLSNSPTRLIWQSGDTVMELVSMATVEELASVTRTFNVDRYDDGLSARMVRGFYDLAGVVSE